MQTGSHLSSPMISSRLVMLVCFAFVLTVLSGCGGGGGAAESSGTQGSGPVPALPGGITVMWDPPVNSDGSAVTGLATYNVYYSNTSPVMLTSPQIITIDDQETAVALSNLSPATYYIAVTAVYNNGDESAPTDEVMAVIQ